MSTITAQPKTALDRVAFDFYETPPAVTEELIQLLGPNLAPHHWVIEPCVGDGAIADVLSKRGMRVITNDLDQMRLAEWHFDAGAPWPLAYGGDWVISNPPFSEIHRIVPQAVREARVATAMLVRLSFLEPVANRKQFLLERPPQHMLTTERISFRRSAKKSTTDSVTTCWLIWTADCVPLDNVPVHGLCLWKGRHAA